MRGNFFWRPVRFAHMRLVPSAALLALVFLVLAAAAPARAAVAIQEVRSELGVTAWLVEDYTVPIVTIHFFFEGGSAQDPAGREGTAHLLSGLFDEGAGELDADAFQESLDDAGAEMSFSAGRDGISGSLRTLAESRDDAFGLLALALSSPRFDTEPLERIRAQIVAGIRSTERDPATQAQIAFAEALYGDHPYARRDEGTPATLADIDADDLRAFHRRVLARDNLTVAVVGAIDARTLAAELDRVFGDLPQNARLEPVEDVEPQLDQEVRVEYNLPQTTLRLAFPGIKRDDPEFFAAFLMNHVLGGGSFSSRLFREVRDRRGLAYGIGSAIANPRHSTSLVIATGTSSERAQETLSIVRQVVREMAEEGPTEEELEAAKRYIVGAYAVNNLDSSPAIANTLVQLQIQELGIDYIERRPALIDAVTREQAAAAARRLLSAEPAILIVGPDAAEGD